MVAADPNDTLFSLPPPFELTKQTVGGETVVTFGPRAVFVFDEHDRAMRNLAMVALRRAGVSGVEVARLFGLRPEHISRLYAQAREAGSAGLIAEMGRPRSLDAAGVALAYRRADEGRTGVEIARELSVSQATISRLLARRPGPTVTQLELAEVPAEADASGQAGTPGDAGSPVVDDDGLVETSPSTERTETDEAEETRLEEEEEEEDLASTPERLQVIDNGLSESRYAGAMLLHGFFHRAGAAAVLSTLSAPGARAYDAASVMLATSVGFALGSLSAEGTKHLSSRDAGAVIGLSRFPHLRTLRPRLAGLAELIDPIELQSRIAKAMLDADDEAPELFFVDDHFVAYTGSAPVRKGWNTRRRHAEPGRDDTVVVDDAWRAILFSSGPPSGLSVTMFAPLLELRRILGDRRVMIGFDRGGSYPKVFAELRRLGFDFVTYRRAPLLTPTVAPSRSWTVVSGLRRYYSIADEVVLVDGLGAVRQLSIYEHGRLALQILTSDMVSPGAYLARRLVGRWCIENAFKYLEDHHGIHWLCDHVMDISPDTSAVANPAREAARAKLRAAEAAVASLERAIGAAATSAGDDIASTNRQLRVLEDELATARRELEQATARLRAIPAKVARNELDPSATRAEPRLGRRAIQMVCRLLAYNAELDLARSLNAYLEDDDEYRAIARNLLHQPGTITYEKTAITVALRAPDSPRIARALAMLCEQLNFDPPRMCGDPRPITYLIEARS